jgi:hypothetical protein
MKPNNAMKLLGVVGVTTATAFMGMGEARAIKIVDTFDTDHFLSEDGGTQNVDASTSEIVGGERNVEYFETPNSFGEGFTQAGFSSPATNGEEILRLNVGSSLQAQSGSVNLTYDGNDSSTAFNNSGLGADGFGIDFTESDTNQGLKFRIFSPESADLTVTLWSNGGTDTANITFDLNNTPSDDFLFFGFDNTAPANDGVFNTDPNFDFADISAVEINLSFPGQVSANREVGIEAFGATPDRDTPIDVAAVPFEAETSAALVLLGGWGAWKYWKRRKQQQINFDDTEA